MLYIILLANKTLNFLHLQDKKVTEFGGFSTTGKQEENVQLPSTNLSVDDSKRKDIDKIPRINVTTPIRTFPLSSLEVMNNEVKTCMHDPLKFN